MKFTAVRLSTVSCHVNLAGEGFKMGLPSSKTYKLPFHESFFKGKMTLKWIKLASNAIKMYLRFFSL